MHTQPGHPATLTSPAAPRALRAPRAARAFTLIEVLVVLGIIAIVASISLVVAGRVTLSGKERTTEDVLRVLDALSQSFVQDNGRLPTTFTDAQGTQFPLIDARRDTAGFAETDKPEPSLALFILTVEQRGQSAEDALKGINKKFLKRTTEAEAAANASNNVAFSPTLNAQPIRTRTTSTPHLGLTVTDAWGEPVRFVHPAYHGGYGDGFALQPDGTYRSVTRLPLERSLADGTTTTTYSFRRAARPFNPANTTGTGDADEGIAPGALGYFYSVGIDKDAGTREDNIYSTRPVFPVETRTPTLQ